MPRAVAVGPQRVATAREAVADVVDGSVVLVGGWGGIGVPDLLLQALAEAGPTRLTVITNNCGMGMPGDIGVLFRAGLVRRAIATYPSHPDAKDFLDRLERGEVELEVVPQGTLAERIRAAGAGLGGFYTPTGAGTQLAEGRETRVIDGKEHLFEEPLFGDVALVKASQVDAVGNLRFRYAARSFNPLMAMAARLTIVQADELVPVGSIPPDDVHLPGLFVDRILVAGEAK